ncbi:MAG: type I-C CRISPR-associated protein Cas8c/Csd1 [Rhodospirillales bacterium]
MSLLSSLVAAYDRLPDAPPPGYALQKIDFALTLKPDGTPGGLIDLREDKGKKKISRLMMVPEPPKRTVKIDPNFLWDKSAYVLGIGSSKRLAAEHAAFVALHREALAGSDDAGLRALLFFLERWRPESFDDSGWPEDLRDANIVFRLLDGGAREFLHERPAARRAWADLRAARGGQGSALCLLSGERKAPARLHPAIKGVWGGQSSGASIVSFNLDAFESYGHKQGANAPVGEEEAFKYTTVLNRFLQTDSGHRVQIGDASCVFWAEAPTLEQVEQAEATGGWMLGLSGIDEEKQAGAVKDILEKIRLGRPLRSFAPKLAEGVRFYVLGLAPNAARLSIRFWFQDDFGVLAQRYRRFLADMAVEPGDGDSLPTLWKYLLELAVQHKRENVPPNLAGDWMRAILTGQRYPQTLLSSALMRIRADKTVNARRVALLKAVLLRNFDMEKEVPVTHDEDNDNRGYRLGRLFALYEYIQEKALGDKVNATIKDKFYGAASSRPRGVFPFLQRNSAHHLSKLRRERPKQQKWLHKKLDEVMEPMERTPASFPATLPTVDQALFALGYHHERKALRDKRGDDQTGKPKDNASADAEETQP